MKREALKGERERERERAERDFNWLQFVGREKVGG